MIGIGKHKIEMEAAPFRGWKFWLTATCDRCRFLTESPVYRTDRDGRGLWVDGRQTVGTCQTSRLPEDRERAKAFIRRHYAVEYCEHCGYTHR